jgi:hypothetical protein
MVGMFVIVTDSVGRETIYMDIVHVLFEFPNTVRLSREGKEDEFIEVGLRSYRVAVTPRG